MSFGGKLMGICFANQRVWGEVSDFLGEISGILGKSIDFVRKLADFWGKLMLLGEISGVLGKLTSFGGKLVGSFCKPSGFGRKWFFRGN